MGSTPYEVVISGISGKFPNCRNVQEFKEKLFSKEMLLVPDEKRWNPVEYEKPFMTGKIPDVDKFDISFFGVTAKLARNSDPVLGPTMECSTEAFVDAGVNPYSLKGRNISVIVASSITDAEVLRYFEGSFLDGQAMQGLARAMFANRISYAFNFTGPSYNVDSSWVSAVQGLEKAAAIVGQGHVEAAVVTCCNLTFHNSLEQEYMDIEPELISQTDKCSPFDAKADGFLRSEGTVAFLLQRAQDAKRSYCTVLNSQTRCLNGLPSSFTAVNPLLETFFRDFYADIKINPKDVSYIETFGFCNKDRDAQELNAVANVFCEKQQTPLLIGSGNGNYGNTETSSSFVSLTKAIIALEEGVIPPTINYSTPNPNVPGLVSGRLKPVTEPTKLPGELVAVNALNFSGNAAHTLLKQNSKTIKPLSLGELPPDGLPRLFILQARNEEGANTIARQVASTPLNPEFASLVNDVFKVPVPHYLWRGFSIVPGSDTKAILETKELDSVKRPVWYVFSGMGSQWAGMGRELLEIPVFAAAIDKCDQYLRLVGVDIKHILTANDPTLFDNILNCFVGITSVQIGLVDVLRTLGVEPDGMIGHSTGETCCAYADGCFTLEQTIMASYFRGQATLDAQGTQIKGMMAAVGIGYDSIKDKVPSTIDIACHNATDSSTISGPADDVIKYVEKLKRDGVFAKAVNVAGVAYHSRYIKTVAPVLYNYLKKIVPNPKPRSSKWISTSVPESQWDTDAAKLCSAEYQTNNLLNPVYFEEGCKYIPKNATIIEIAPHGLLQAILRRSISADCVNISLTSRTAGSNVYHLLNAIGRLHLNNVEVDVNALYPPVQYPVARGTPPLSTLVTWDHEETRLQEFRAEVKMIIQKNASELTVSVSGQVPDFELWRDHRVNGQVVLPTMQLLTYPWTMIFTSKRLEISKYSVVLEDVIISEQVSIKDMDQLLLVTFSPASLKFEVSYQTEEGLSGRNIVTGKLQETKISPFSIPEINLEPGKFEKVNSREVYDVLAQIGFNMGPQFQVIKQIIIGEHECIAKIKWTSDIIVFVDALLKFLTFLKVDQQQLSSYLPTSFIKLVINKPLLAQMRINTVMDVHYDPRCNRLVCEAAELLGVTFKSIPYKTNDCLMWKELKFKPYFESKLSLKDFLRTSLQLAKETDLGVWMKRPPQVQVLLVRPKSCEKLSTHQCLEKVILDHPQIYGNVSEVDLDKATDLLKSPELQRYIVVGEHTTLTTLSEAVSTDKLYCITLLKAHQATSSLFRPIFSCSHLDGKLALLKKINSESPVVLPLEGNDWLERLRGAVEDRGTSTPIVLVTRSLVPRHVLPVLAAEPFVTSLRTFFIQQTNAQCSPTSPTFSSQLLLGLPVNVLSEGVWGSLRTEDLDIDLHNNLSSYFNRADAEIDLNYIGLNAPTFDRNSNFDLSELRCVDYSGTVEAKQQVMGVAQFHPDTKYLTLDPVLRWPVPFDWSLLDAATVPVIYGLAYYCIHLMAKVKAGETVLVQAGMSPIGQAIICFALRAQANIITFVENKEEDELLRKRFPEINRSHILISSMEDEDIPVKKLTKGKGVEVIVNCLRGRGMQSVVKVVGQDCRLLHLGHISVEDRESIGMMIFLRRTSVYGVSVENVMRCSVEEKVQIQKAIQEGITKGDVKPLRRKVFSSRSQSEIIEFLETKNMDQKTVLRLKEESSVRSFHFNAQDFVIIAGTSSNLWLEVATWVISHGGQNLIVLTTEKMLACSNFHKVDSLICRHKSTLILYPLSRFDTLQDGIEFFEELLQMRSIDSLICVTMDENSNRMKNLDLASRKAVPGLRQFVTLLGRGAGVCESRAHCGLPVCSVQRDTSLECPANILPYLTTLLSNKSSNARFYVVGDSTRTSRKSDMTMSLMDVKEYLPQTVTELEVLGSTLSRTQLQEASSLCPRYEYIKHQLLPFFVIPGISNCRIEALTQQLMHPVFCPTQPPSLATVEQCAHYLLEQIESIQKKGPYNLIAETWSGAVTLHLTSLLEAQGHRVVVFLLDAAPSLSQAWARVFRKPSGVFASGEFLSCLLGSQGNVPKGLNDFTTWDEQLELTLKHLKSSLHTSQESLDCIGKYLSALKTRLTNLLDYQHQQLSLKANIHSIRTKEASDSELSDLLKCCQQRPTLHIMENETLKEVMQNPKTAAVINENALFTWNI